MEQYRAYLRGLSDTTLRAETVQAVNERNVLRIEYCRQQWEALGRAQVFLACYNEAVNGLQ